MSNANFGEGRVSTRKIFFLHRYSLPCGFCLRGVERKLFQLSCLAFDATYIDVIPEPTSTKDKPYFIRYSVFVHFTLTLSMCQTKESGTEWGNRRQMFLCIYLLPSFPPALIRPGTCLVIDTTSLFVIDTIAVFFVLSASCKPTDVSSCSLNRARRAHENDLSSGFAGAMLVADNDFFVAEKSKALKARQS